MTLIILRDGITSITIRQHDGMLMINILQCDGMTDNDHVAQQYDYDKYYVVMVCL